MNRRNLMVKFDSAGRSLPEILADAKQAVAQKVSFDSRRYGLEWIGHFEDEQRAEARFVLILGLILGLMIVFLYAEFGLLRQVALILCAVPLATLGGLTALHVTGVTLNVASAVGFIALFGVAVMNGVIMVANLNRVQDTGVSLLDAVIAGASERLRPVLMTATVATVGMLPAALATGVGSDVQRSIATVVAGGLIPATFLTLFLIPTFYFAIERRAQGHARGRSNSRRSRCGRRPGRGSVHSLPRSSKSSAPPRYDDAITNLETPPRLGRLWVLARGFCCMCHTGRPM